MGIKVKLNDLEIWYEDYGDKNNETVLLIMGANANCKQWDQLFIDRLVEENFHVVRFDINQRNKRLLYSSLLFP